MRLCYCIVWLWGMIAFVWVARHACRATFLGYQLRPCCSNLIHPCECIFIHSFSSFFLFSSYSNFFCFVFLLYYLRVCSIDRVQSFHIAVVRCFVFWCRVAVVVLVFFVSFPCSSFLMFASWYACGRGVWDRTVAACGFATLGDPTVSSFRFIRVVCDFFSSFSSFFHLRTLGDCASSWFLFRLFHPVLFRFGSFVPLYFGSVPSFHCILAGITPPAFVSSVRFVRRSASVCYSVSFSSSFRFDPSELLFLIPLSSFLFLSIPLCLVLYSCGR